MEHLFCHARVDFDKLAQNRFFLRGGEMGSDDTSSAVVAAVHWLVALIQGSVANSVAVLAIGSVGMMMLTGRLDLRHAVRVILGCFLLFGASAVAQGLAGAVHPDAAPAPGDAAAASYHPPNAPALRAVPPSNYDPYAGAAFIPHR